jgi:L-fuconolactonase
LNNSEIVDPHHHLWDTSQLRYALLDRVPELKGAYTAENYDRLARPHGVTASVCVEAASAGADGTAETRWLIDETRRSEIVERLVLWAPLGSPELPAYLDRLEALEDRRIAGIRRSFELEPDDFARRPDVIRGVELAAERGYSVDLVLFHRSLRAAVELVRACPEARFILDHLGKPDLRESRGGSWAEDIAAMAQSENVVCKVSGLVTEADHNNWRAEDLQAPIDHVIASFGWDRVLFGSDWPVCNRAGGFERWLDAVRWCVRDASEEQKRAFFAENARRVYEL